MGKGTGPDLPMGIVGHWPRARGYLGGGGGGGSLKLICHTSR